MVNKNIPHKDKNNKDRITSSASSSKRTNSDSLVSKTSSEIVTALSTKSEIITWETLKFIKRKEDFEKARAMFLLEEKNFALNRENYRLNRENYRYRNINFVNEELKNIEYFRELFYLITVVLQDVLAIEDIRCVFYEDKLNDEFEELKSDKMFGLYRHIKDFQFKYWKEKFSINHAEISKSSDLTLKIPIKIDWIEIWEYLIWLTKKEFIDLDNKYYWSIFSSINSAIENLLQKEISVQSNYDALTWVYWRRFINSELEVLLKFHIRNGIPLTVLFFDVDKFKEINDIYWHEIWDKALKVFSKTIDEHLRDSDIIGRFWWDEFIVILPDTSEVWAKKLLDKLLEVIRSIDIPVKNGKSIWLTSSIWAYICTPKEWDNAKSFIKKSDEAMYLAKEAWRNRYVINHW
jgi:diguanylate cyclase (GGDEF)-like protein